MSRNQLATSEGRRRRKQQDEKSRSEAQRAELIERTRYVVQREKLYPDQDGLAPGERMAQLLDFVDKKFAETYEDDAEEEA